MSKRRCDHKTINDLCLRLLQVAESFQPYPSRSQLPRSPEPFSLHPSPLITPRCSPLSVTAARAVKPLIEIGYSFICIPIKPKDFKESSAAHY